MGPLRHFAPKSASFNFFNGSSSRFRDIAAASNFPKNRAKLKKHEIRIPRFVDLFLEIGALPLRIDPGLGRDRYLCEIIIASLSLIGK